MEIFFTSGDWIAKEGHEDRFVAAFRKSGAVELDPPLQGLLKRPQLFEDVEHPRHYRSYAEWESLDAIQEFRSRPDFRQMLQAMREHLESFTIFTGKLIDGM
ncbi:MAG: antibiotic biosynthesis monooxygenase [Actinobacteria bacterium]|nr:antibiotic biosynthesis monooxygenase [Actinomycetota bacterium]